MMPLTSSQEQKQQEGNGIAATVASFSEGKWTSVNCYIETGKCLTRLLTRHFKNQNAVSSLIQRGDIRELSRTALVPFCASHTSESWPQCQPVVHDNLDTLRQFCQAVQSPILLTFRCERWTVVNLNKTSDH